MQLIRNRPAVKYQTTPLGTYKASLRKLWMVTVWADRMPSFWGTLQFSREHLLSLALDSLYLQFLPGSSLLHVAHLSSFFQVFSPQRYFNIDPNTTQVSGNCGCRKSNLFLHFQGGLVNFTFTKVGPEFRGTYQPLCGFPSPGALGPIGAISHFSVRLSRIRFQSLLRSLLIRVKGAGWSVHISCLPSSPFSFLYATEGGFQNLLAETWSQATFVLN